MPKHDFFSESFLSLYRLEKTLIWHSESFVITNLWNKSFGKDVGVISEGSPLNVSFKVLDACQDVIFDVDFFIALMVNHHKK